MANHCEACGKSFRSLAAFDKHRTGDYARPGERKGTRRCMTTQEMLAVGMLRNKNMAWITASMPVGKIQSRKKAAA